MAAGPHHELWEDAAGAYLLDALPDDERRDFEAHLEACRACQEEVAGLRVGADALPASVPQVEPPPELRDRIMTIVHREAELLAAAGPEADRGPARARRERPARRFWARPAFALPVVAATLLVGVLVGGGLKSGDGTPLRTVPAGQFASLLVQGDTMRLRAAHLPAPPPGRVYQVWVQRRGGHAAVPTNALFGVSGDGTASVDVPDLRSEVQRVMVTDEPPGGSLHPTGTVVIDAVVPA